MPQITLANSSNAIPVVIDHSTNSPGAMIIAKVVGDNIELTATRKSMSEDSGVPWVSIPWTTLILFLFFILAPFQQAIAQSTTNYQFTAFPNGATSEVWKGKADLLRVDYDAVNYDEGADSNLLQHVTGIDAALVSISPVSYNAPQAGVFIDDYIEMPQGNTGAVPAYNSPISQALRWEGVFTIDSVIFPDLMGQDPNDNTVSCIITIIGADYMWDPILGPVGTIKYQWTEADMESYPEGGSRYELSPPWTTINGELFTIFLQFTDQSAITGVGWESAFPMNVSGPGVATGTEITAISAATRYPAGVPDATIHSTVRYAPIWHKQSVDNTEIITTLLQSDSLVIDATGGELSLERFQQPNYATEDMSANLVEIPGAIRTTGTGGKAGHNYIVTANSTFEVLGFTKYVDTSDRGEQILYGVRTQDESLTYASGSYDDAGGVGTEYISFLFPDPVELQTGENYAFFTDYADGDGGGYNWKSAPTYSDAYVTWYGHNHTGTLRDPSGTDQHDLKLILNTASDLKPWNILEQGTNITFAQTGTVLTVHSIPTNFPSYERHIQLEATTRGSPAAQPSEVTVGTAAGLQFASTGTEYAYVQWEIPDDWDGGDVLFEPDWHPDGGGMTGTDVVKWDINYRSRAEGELINGGTVASVTVSYDVAVDGALPQYTIEHSPVTMAFNDANQPLAAQDHVFIQITRDTGVANDYAGTVAITAFEILYQSTGLPTSN